MAFSVKGLSSLGRNLLNLAGRVKIKVRQARYQRGLLAPVASSRSVARQAKQKGLEGIARTAREGDRVAQIELRKRGGDFR